jgi:Domain of unknown function (DUF4105)
MLKKLIIVLLFLLSVKANSQYYKLSDQAKISVLTVGSGNELYSIYGHTGLRILDIANKIDIVYNYGNFDFGTENFYGKFVKGDLQYFVAICSFQDFMEEYRISDREVLEQNLLISTLQKQKLFDELNASLYSNERFYTYKFIDKNCTTMILNKVNTIFGGEIVTKKNNTDASYRTVLHQFVKNHFWEDFGINIIFGQKVDNPSKKLFLPEELMINLETTKYNGKHIVDKAVVINKKKDNSEYFSFWNSIYFFCIILVLIAVFSYKKWVVVFYFTILGLFGVFFSLVGFYSFHEEISRNYNVLVFNPSLLVLLYFMFRKYKKGIVYLSYFNLICLFFYIVILINKTHLLTIIPMILTSVYLFYKLIKTNKSLLTSIK